jgi:hypothetical protein
LKETKNSAYFHCWANQRRRKKWFFLLQGPDGDVEDNDGILKIVVDYYKCLFCYEDKPNIDIVADFWGEKE